jgi:hypothetical protein
MSLLASAESIGKWKGAQGEVEVYRFESVAAYIRMEGIAEQAAAPVIERALDGLFRSVRAIHTFWDLRDLINYHSDVRVYSTNVLLAHRARLSSVHTLSTSKIVAMGVSVANLALGGIITNHKTQVGFEMAVRGVLPRD